MPDPGPELTTEGFAHLFETTMRRQIRVWPSRSWAPSQAGHPCDRYQVWRWTRADEQLPHDPGTEAVFQEGNVHAPHVYARLEQMGFRIVRESDRPERWQPKPGVIVSGKIDGRVIGYRSTRYTPPRVLEIKTIAPHAFDQIRSYQDIVQHRAFYIRGYATQMQIYLLLDGVSDGVFVFKNKVSGALKLIPATLDLAAAEAAIARIERLDPMVKAQQDPPPIPFDASVCGRCGFLIYCYPVQEAEGMEVVDDGDLVELLEEHARAKTLKYAFEDLDQQVKARFERVLTEDGQRALIRGGKAGDWIASLKIVNMPSRVLKEGQQRRLSLAQATGGAGGDDEG